MAYANKIQLSDQYGLSVECTPMDELRVIEPVRLVGTSLEGLTIDSNFWTQSTGVTGGSANQTNYMLEVVTDNQTGSAKAVYSVRSARYVAGSSNRYRANIFLSDIGIANNVRQWGVCNPVATTFAPTDGAYFELSGTTMNIVTLKGSTPTAVASTNWNVSTTVPTLTNVNTYEIYYLNKKVYFIINGVLVHTVTATTTTWSNTKNYFVFLNNVNTNVVAGNKSIYCLTQSISRLGKIKSEVMYKYITTATTTVCKLGQGKIHKIIHSGSGANIITVVDNTTGSTPVIGVINGQNNQPQYIDFGADGCPFFTGLSVVTSQSISCTIIYE